MPLTRDRDTPARDSRIFHLPVAANARIYSGALVVQDGGVAKPGGTALNLVAIGRAAEAVDNTGGADGAKRVKVERGTFFFKNSSADPITAADLFKDCFIVDDETVAKTNGTNTRSKAGIVRGVETNGVWVEF